MPQRQAFSLLSQRHLCPEEMPAQWPGAAKARLGTVVDQDPTPGVRVGHGTPITVWVREREPGTAGMSLELNGENGVC
jgi:hypothetical protein